MTDVLVRTVGTSAVLTFNRPEQHNSIGGELLGDLIDAVESADDDPEIRAIVTTGEGASYCVGLDADTLTGWSGSIDLGEIGTDEASGRTGLRVFPMEARRVDHLGIGRWVTRFLEVGTPTIAAINGPAAGGGLGLAMLHDLRVMSRDAKLAPSFGLLGLGAEFGLSWLLPRLIGPSRAFRTMTRGTPIKAEEALDLGLVDAVVDAEDLIPAALELAQPFAVVHDRSVRSMKRLLRQSWESTLLEQLEREWLSQRTLFTDPRTIEAMEALRARLARHES
ncbi:enoyl-CoA hydratase/isomerase family protein [Streptomyces sp. NPDC002405]